VVVVVEQALFMNKQPQSRISPPNVMFYHSPCPDGLSCCLVAEDYFGPENKIEFREWTHGREPNLTGLAGKEVWVCDVCPTGAQLLASDKLARAKLVDVKDHHYNAPVENVARETDIAKMKVPIDIFESSKSFPNLTMILEKGNRCGALMLYSFFHPNATAIPSWLDAINKGDTNLITSRTPEERAYHAWVTRPEVLKTTTTFRAALAEDVKTATAAGDKLLRERQAECDKALAELTIEKCTAADQKSQHLVGYTSASGPEIISQIFEYVCSQSKKPLPFEFLAIRWVRQVDNVRQISLRSPPGSDFDVSAIARLNGGGGHRLASGVPYKTHLECWWTIGQMTRMLDELKTNIERLHQLIIYAQGQCLACTRQQMENTKDIAVLEQVLSKPNSKDFEEGKKGFQQQLEVLKKTNIVPSSIWVDIPQGQ
jgi:hypothetical protein